MKNLGRPTVKAGPDYGEWHYPPELPDGYIVASRDRKGWLVRVRAGANPEQRVQVGAEEVPGRDTLRSAAAVGLTKAVGGTMRMNPDEEGTEQEDGSKLTSVKTARKAQQRIGILRKLFGTAAGKAGAQTAAKVGAKTAAKVGAKTAAKGGAKFVPGVGEVIMVLDALPEAVRVEKEKFQTMRDTAKSMKEAQGFKETASAFGRGVGKYTATTVTGAARVGAAAIVGSDVVQSTMKRRNPSSTAQNYAEITQMLRTMPSDWRSQLRSGSSQLGVAFPATPTPEQAMLLIGITAGGNPSGDVPYGPNIVPEEVREEAMKGLRLSHKNNYGAYNFIGIARGIELAISRGVSDKTMKRMRNYFTRHAKDRLGKNWGNAARPSRGWMAWLNWGGDAGYNWVNNMRPNPRYDLENPYHKEGRDRWGKVCFYIYNDDGSQVVGPMGPRFCYKVEKAEEMVREAERRGLRVSPSPVSPGPRPTPAPAAASTGYVRQRIQEQAAKPITHSFRVGDIIDGHYWSLDYVHFYVVRSVSPSSVVVQEVAKHQVSGHAWDGTYTPNLNAPLGKPFRIMLDANGNLKGRESMVYKKWSGQPLRQTSNMD